MNFATRSHDYGGAKFCATMLKYMFDKMLRYTATMPAALGAIVPWVLFIEQSHFTQACTSRTSTFMTGPTL